MGLETVRKAEEIGLSSEGLANLKRQLVADIDSEVCDGVVMIVARGGKVGFSEALGKSDLQTGRDTKKDDVFCMMSCSKEFTATEILRLADIGKLRLDDKVCKHVPEFAAKGKQNVTIYQLLSHTGGAWPFLFPTPGMTPMDYGNLEKSWRFASAQTLMDFPGTRVRYTPWAGYAVLGEILRRVNGGDKRFCEIISDNWFKPLGMSDTTYGYIGDQNRRVPIVLREKAEGAGDAAAFEMMNKSLVGNAEVPAANAFSTAENMLKYTEMLRNRGTFEGRRYLSQAICEYAFRNHTANLPNDFWDYSKEMRGIPQFPANFTLGGGFARGTGDYFTPHASAASPNAFAAVGGGSTMNMYDPAKELSVVFLAAGLNEGLAHFQRLHYINNLVYSALMD
jgi:CubicO group peptidase (beta-lactamase class C family)